MDIVKEEVNYCYRVLKLSNQEALCLFELMAIWWILGHSRWHSGMEAPRGQIRELGHIPEQAAKVTILQYIKATYDSLVGVKRWETDNKEGFIKAKSPWWLPTRSEAELGVPQMLEICRPSKLLGSAELQVWTFQLFTEALMRSNSRQRQSWRACR